MLEYTKMRLADYSKPSIGCQLYLYTIISSDQREYTIDELKDYPEDIIYLALNEIYSRHGYIFKNEDLQNYFMGQVWYTPLVEGENFSDEVFNDYEKENLKVLLKILNR